MFLSRLRYTVNGAKKFVDSSVIEKDVLRLSIHGGSGGQGLPRYNGVGGDGGNVYLLPRRNMKFPQLFNSFYNRKRQLIAEHGSSSNQLTLIGKHGKHEILQVPLGSECIDEVTRKLICRCTVPNKSILIAKGGKGGCAANEYKGQKGERLVMGLHMKLQPNMGLVGFPNAGKSTLLKALAPEKKSIKIAPYPFTTTRPQMIDVRFDEFTGEQKEDRFSLSCADLPGLIEGAAENRGKGHAFLKHLEYSDILVFVIDVHGFKLSANLNDHLEYSDMLVFVIDVHGFKLSANLNDVFRTPLETIALLNKELEAYDRKLVKKPCVLVLNKIDLPDGEKKAEEVENIVKSEWHKKLPSDLKPSLPIHFRGIIKTSAKNGEIGSLKLLLHKIYDELHPLQSLSFDEEFEEKSGSVLL
uniref:GTP-binding protein 10 n=1 Tax=Panagrolaimus sp. ES5 TaxID=591445 RepID=A0AC34GPY9_9BILA